MLALSIAALLLFVAVNSTLTFPDKVDVLSVAPSNEHTKPDVALPAVIPVTKYVAELLVTDSLARVMSDWPAELHVALVGVLANSPPVNASVTRPLAEYCAPSVTLILEMVIASEAVALAIRCADTTSLDDAEIVDAAA